MATVLETGYSQYGRWIPTRCKKLLGIVQQKGSRNLSCDIVTCILPMSMARGISCQNTSSFLRVFVKCFWSPLQQNVFARISQSSHLRVVICPCHLGKRDKGKLHSSKHPSVDFTMLRLSSGAYSRFYSMTILYLMHKLHSEFNKKETLTKSTK